MERAKGAREKQKDSEGYGGERKKQKGMPRERDERMTNKSKESYKNKWRQAEKQPLTDRKRRRTRKTERHHKDKQRRKETGEASKVKHVPLMLGSVGILPAALVCVEQRKQRERQQSKATWRTCQLPLLVVPSIHGMHTLTQSFHAWSFSWYSRCSSCVDNGKDIKVRLRMTIRIKSTKEDC